MVNWCCTNCSTQFAAPYPDAYGVVQVHPYTEAAASPVWTFKDDAQSIMQPTVEATNEWQSAANVVRMYYESDECAMWASASNLSGTRASLDARGNREATYYEMVDEIASLDALKARCESKLLSESSEIERVSLLHGYAPITTGEPVSIIYADRTWTGTVQNMSIDLSPSAQTQTQIRRYIAAAIETTTDGAVIWSA